MDLLFEQPAEHETATDCEEARTLHNDARKHSRTLKFSVGDTVMARNYGTSTKWVPARVIKLCGSRVCLVEVPGSVWKRHFEQLRKCGLKYDNVAEPEEVIFMPPETAQPLSVNTVPAPPPTPRISSKQLHEKSDSTTGSENETDEDGSSYLTADNTDDDGSTAHNSPANKNDTFKKEQENKKELDKTVGQRRSNRATKGVPPPRLIL